MKKYLLLSLLLLSISFSAFADSKYNRISDVELAEKTVFFNADECYNSFAADENNWEWISCNIPFLEPYELSVDYAGAGNEFENGESISVNSSNEYKIFGILVYSDSISKDKSKLEHVALIDRLFKKLRPDGIKSMVITKKRETK